MVKYNTFLFVWVTNLSLVKIMALYPLTPCILRYLLIVYFLNLNLSVYLLSHNLALEVRIISSLT